MSLLEEFVTESNKIEGIMRRPTSAEIAATEEFVELQLVTVAALRNFVSVMQPDAKLRVARGMNVRIGRHFPPVGGPGIEGKLQDILDRANITQNRANNSYSVHLDYQLLHPFTDGNGRSGRMLWLWQIGGKSSLGFLHSFYYQTLQNLQQK